MFRGTEKAFELLMKYGKEYNIVNYADPDIDGAFSALLIRRFLEAYGFESVSYINDNRKHGFFLDLDCLDGCMLICTDFQIKEEALKEIQKRDIILINIDHHSVGSEELVEWDKGVVINNQYPFEPEEQRYLSGAGVVFETLCSWDSRFKTQEHFAIVGITLLSDIRPIENKYARRYLDFTYSIGDENEYFKYLVENTMKEGSERYSFGMPRMDRNYIDFTFSPRINSMFRYNESYEALDFIFGYGMKTDDKRGVQKAFVEYLTLCSTQAKGSNLTVAVVNEEDLDAMTLARFESPEPSNFIGFAGSQIKGIGNSVVILLLDKDGNIKRGSFRGKYDDVPYLDLFKSRGIVCDGHKAAFGIMEMKLAEDDLDELNYLIGKLEEGHEQTYKLIEVNNLSMYLNRSGSRVAKENTYVRDTYRTFIKYTGSNYYKRRGGESYIEYDVDGHLVKCFDSELTPENSYIVPVMEKGYTHLYLREVTF